MHGRYGHAHFDDLDLDARSQWLDRGKFLALNYLDNLVSNIRIKLAVTVSHDKFYLNPKLSVDFILNYGHTSVSYKTHIRNLVIVCAYTCAYVCVYLCTGTNVTWTKNMPLTALGYTEHGSV